MLSRETLAWSHGFPLVLGLPVHSENNTKVNLESKLNSEVMREKIAEALTTTNFKSIF